MLEYMGSVFKAHFGVLFGDLRKKETSAISIPIDIRLFINKWGHEQK